MKTAAYLPLYNKIYSLLKMLYVMVKNWPKEYKYSLGQDVISLGWRGLDLVIEANALDDDSKAGKIAELSAVFDRLKLRLRLAQEINLLSAGQFAHLQENYLQEIGREIGGWLKWARS